MILKTVICDDNKQSNFIVNEYINQINIPQIKVIGTFEDGYSLIDFCKTNKIDLILLDIDMPIINGIDTGKEVLKLLPLVSIIILTGYPEYSLQAFEIHPIDYILKPISIERLKRALEYVVRKNKEETNIDNKHNLTIETKKTIYSIKKDDLLFAERVGKKTIIHTPKTIVEVSDSLKSLQNRLDKKSFIRTHNSFLVNKSAIFKIEKSKSGIGKIFLKDYDKYAYLSRRNRNKFENSEEFFI